MLPFIIAVTYMLVFSWIDSYPYALSSPDDQGLFQRIALNLVKRGAFSGSLAGKAVFCPTRPPLYPLILALTWKVTGSTSLIPIRIIQGASYLLTIYLISRIATMVAGGEKRYGLLSALFASLIPFAAAATHVILTESLALFFLTTAAFLAVRFRTKSGRASLIALGVSLGFLILQRPTFMLIPGLFLGYVLLFSKIGRKDILPVVLLVMLPLSAVVVPWTLYARSKTGTWSLVRTGVGFNLISGIVESNPSLRKTMMRYWSDMQTDKPDRQAIQEKLENSLTTEKESTSWEDATPPAAWRLLDLAAASYSQGWHLNPPATRTVVLSDRFLKKTALLWIRYHPWQFSAIVVSNIKTLLFADYQPLVCHIIGGYPYLYTVVARWCLYAFSLMGAFLLLRHRKFHIVLFPWAVIFYIIIVHSMMHTEPRYFMYAYTFMTITVPALLPGVPSARGKTAAGGPDRCG